MKFGEDVLTKDRKGNLEVRNLVSRGKFVLYDYRDPKTFKQVESSKRKLYLKDEEFYLIPLKGERWLMIKPKVPEDKVRKVWNDKTKKEESLFK